MRKTIGIALACGLGLAGACGKNDTQARQTQQAAQQAQQAAQQAQQAAQQAQQAAQQAQQALQAQQMGQKGQPAAQPGQPAGQQPEQAAQQPQQGAQQQAQSVSGRVSSVSNDEIVLSRTGQPDLRIRVEPTVPVMVDGQTSSLRDVPVGATARVTYQQQGDQSIAKGIDATTKQPVRGAEQPGQPQQPSQQQEPQP